jgi:glycosyltransferase involved in cell wall biosynthesis
MPEGYSVVIPTVGSRTLARAIASAWAQTHRPEAVVVVGDRVDESVLTASVAPSVTFVPSPRPGVAAARNAGVAEVRSDWVAFLDDDDVWLPDKVARQLGDRRADDPVVLLSAATVSRGARTSIRPSRADVLAAGEDVLARLYGARRYGPSSAYLPTPSVVVPRAVAIAHPFDESLPVREDLWWFHQVQRAGIPVLQCADPLVTVHACRRRSRRRETTRSLGQWVDRLEAVDVLYARNFLLGMALRESLLSGDFGQAAWIVRTAVGLQERRA